MIRFLAHLFIDPTRVDRITRHAHTLSRTRQVLGSCPGW